MMAKVVEQRVLPDNWRWVRLGDVCEIIGGGILPPHIDGVAERDRIYGLKVSDLNSEFSDGYQLTGSQHHVNIRTLKKRILSPQDIILPKRGGAIATNKKRILDISAILDPNLMGLHPKKSFLLPEYLFHWLQSWDLSSIQNGSSVPQINRKDLFPLSLPLPPIAEQNRIVGILSDRLSTIEQARQATQAQLEAAQALPTAYLRQVFNSPEAEKWEKKPLGDVARVGAGITLGRKFKGGVPIRQVHYLRVANVKDGYLDLSDITTTEATDAEIKKCLLQYGDILLTEGGDPDKLGRGTYWQNELSECIHQNHIFRVRFDLNDYVPNFISAQIGSPYGKAYFLANAKQTTGIATINQRVLKGFPLMVPPVETQKEVILELETKLKQARAVEQSLQDQLDTINALPAALLRQAFNGEL